MSSVTTFGLSNFTWGGMKRSQEVLRTLLDEFTVDDSCEICLFEPGGFSSNSSADGKPFMRLVLLTTSIEVLLATAQLLLPISSFVSSSSEL